MVLVERSAESKALPNSEYRAIARACELSSLVLSDHLASCLVGKLVAVPVTRLELTNYRRM